MKDPLEDLAPLQRWRLVLGESAEEGLGGVGAEGEMGQADQALGWLYGREDEGEDGQSRDITDRQAGQGPSQLTVPDWINQVHRLFPQETIERMERDAVERYHLHEVVTNPDVLERVEPSPALLKAVLRTKHLMNEEVLELARTLVRKVVQRLMEVLATEVERAFSGRMDRQRHSPLRYSKNFDAKRTLRENLRHIDPETGRLVLKKPWFFGRTRNYNKRWQVLIVVDQSGSMLGSTIHAAVLAACLWGLPGVDTHLIVFDTEVVDLTADVTDPVELLMKVQLGGGTDICRAVRYGQQLVNVPRRTLFVLITDFYEGGNAPLLVRTVEDLCHQGVTFVGLAALDPDAVPAYDHDLAQKLVDVGATIGAMTPGELAGFLAEAMSQ